MEKIISQGGLARAVGCTPAYISRLRNGQKNALYPMARRISKALGSKKTLAWLDSTRWEERAGIMNEAFERNRGE